MVGFSDEDERWMLEAVAAGQPFKGYTSPNPPVGCVLVRDGECLGRGGHTKAGAPHGEVEAIRDAGECRGATAYVTLEPCNHYGRTGPCVQALIEAGVTRVVIGVPDPNPSVEGRGAEALRAAGIEVLEGVASEACENLMAPFLRFCRTGLPFVTMKVASTLDGKIGQNEGGQVWLTGDVANAEMHRVRDRVDAIVVGVGTVLSDDPRLTTRLPEGKESHQPLRVILDRQLRTPEDAYLTKTAVEFPTRVYTIGGAEEKAAAGLIRRGVDLRMAPPEVETEQVFLSWVLRDLAEDGKQHVLVEGGSRVNTSLLGGGWVSEVIWLVTPSIGGAPFVPAIHGNIAPSLRDRIRLGELQVTQLGTDICVRGKVIMEEE